MTIDTEVRVPHSEEHRAEIEMYLGPEGIPNSLVGAAVDLFCRKIDNATVKSYVNSLRAADPEVEFTREHLRQVLLRCTVSDIHTVGL